MASTPGMAEPSARARILATAHDLFYRDGVRATGIDRVIAQASVTKVTFYRQFPSKNELVLAYLEMRHERWMTWFRAALQRHGSATRGAAALAPALGEWLRSTEFRGCAFLNTVGELAGELPGVIEAAQRHKQEVADTMAELLPMASGRAAQARALCMAMDGAIVRAQFGEPPERVLKDFSLLVRGVLGARK